MNLLALRSIDAIEQSLSNYCLTTDGQYILKDAWQNFVLIEAELNNRSVNLYCDAELLLRMCSADSQSLPLELIDEQMLLSLTRSYFNSNELQMPVSGTVINKFRVKYFIDSDQINYPIISMKSSTGVIWGCVADIQIPEADKLANQYDWEQISLFMQIVVGHTVINAVNFSTLATGDVLIIANQDCRAVIANKLVLRLNFSGEHMVIESIEDDMEMPTDDEVRMISSGELSLDNLELKVDFLVEEQTITLAELRCLQLNQLLPLDNNISEVNVWLRVGKHIIACGELVRVNDKLAVEIKKIMGSE